MTQAEDGVPLHFTEPRRLAPHEPTADEPTGDDTPASTDVGAAGEAGGDTTASAVPLLELSALPPVIESASELADAVQAFAAGTGPIAIDAERASGFRYSSRAYLVQLRRAQAGTALIDPIPFGDVPNDCLRPLSEAILDASWVLHAASQDLACLAELGMRPRELFDTELAGRLLNYPRVGLAVLVEELLGVRLRKEHSAVDWSRRPLPESWLRYAALDVEVLVELRDALADQLRRSGKAEWARQEFAALAATTFGLPRVDPWRRTSGIHRVRGRRGLAIVKALWEQRDTLARERDTIPSRILPDAAVVAAALAAPRSRRGLSGVPGFATRSAQRHLRQFSAVIAAACALDDADLPRLAPPTDGPPPARAWVAKHPAAAERLAKCRQAVREVAATVDVPSENVLPPDAIRRLAWQPPQPVSEESVAAALASAGARPWQMDLTAADLAAALDAGPAGTDRT